MRTCTLSSWGLENLETKSCAEMTSPICQHIETRGTKLNKELESLLLKPKSRTIDNYLIFREARDRSFPHGLELVSDSGISLQPQGTHTLDPLLKLLSCMAAFGMQFLTTCHCSIFFSFVF